MPAGGTPRPTLGESLTSLSVLPVTDSAVGSTVCPVEGANAAFPYSEGFAVLKGNEAASSSVPCIFSMERSSGGLSAWAGPLLVERADVFVAPGLLVEGLAEDLGA